MATIPAKQTPDSAVTETVEQRFHRLTAEWEDAVAYQSSTTVIISHPAYGEVARLGPEVVPFLLRDMEDHHTHWFWALHEITGADPIPETAGGNIPKMVQAWLDWAKVKHGPKTAVAHG
jgi:hypothetical protein